jgi:hypothetical protein
LNVQEKGRAGDVSVFQMGPVVKSRGALGIFLESSCKNSVLAARIAPVEKPAGWAVMVVVACVWCLVCTDEQVHGQPAVVAQKSAHCATR